MAGRFCSLLGFQFSFHYPNHWLIQSLNTFFFLGLVWFFSHTFVYAVACSEQAVEETTANHVKSIKYAIGKLSSYDQLIIGISNSSPVVHNFHKFLNFEILIGFLGLLVVNFDLLLFGLVNFVNQTSWS